MKSSKRILISGAGIAGLTCAAWLRKNGFQPIVVEKANSIRAGGFLVSLSHHAYHFAEELGVIEAIKQRDARINSSSYHDASGRCLLSLDYSKLFSQIDVVQPMRDGFAEVLYETVKDNVEIRFNQTIDKLLQSENRCQVEFSNGIQEDYDLVIGADGLHSGVRELAFPNNDINLHYLDLCCAAYRIPNVLNIENKFETHMHRDRYMAVFNTGEEDIGAVFVWTSNSRDVPNGHQRISVLQSAFKESSSVIQKVVENAPQNKSFYMDSLLQVEAKQWCNKRVVLVGDAAHCLTLFSGRGAAAAFSGASRLSQALACMPIEEAMSNYERQMRPIIEDIQPATRKAVKWYVPQTKINHMVRNGSMWLLPNALFRNYFRMKYSNI